MRPHPDEVSRACLAHLEREETVLHGTLATLQRVRHALMEGDLTGLANLQQEQESAAEATTSLRDERDALRKHFGSSLGIAPAAVTLARLADLLPDAQREPVTAAGDRLRALAGQVDDLNRNNAALVAHCLGFTRRFLLEVTGGESPASRYNRTGPTQDVAFGALVSARG